MGWGVQVQLEQNMHNTQFYVGSLFLAGQVTLGAVPPAEQPQ